MDETLIKKLVLEVLSHPTFLKIRGRQIDIFLEGEQINAAAFDNSRVILENRMGLVFTTASLKLPQNQIRALIAHELGHHLNFDYKPKSWHGLFIALALVASLICALFAPVGSIGIMGVGLFAEAAARAITSRRAEYRADRIAAIATNAHSVVELLSNFDTNFAPEIRILGMFKSHPSAIKRIKKIRKNFSSDFSDKIKILKSN